ncbi:hypothetical protein BASA81_003318 [Batrachochytrium salamandrivorans]|nr:hypothetical protein BASA81_003318 [Batrachochytrium salamandrivorans]
MSKEVSVSLRLEEEEGEREVVSHHKVFSTTTVLDLKLELASHNLHDFALVYQNQLLQDADLICNELLPTDQAPTLFVAVFKHAPTVLLKFKTTQEQVSCRTVGELKAKAGELLKSKAGGGILVDLAFNGQSLMGLEESTATASLTNQPWLVVDVVSGGGGFNRDIRSGQDLVFYQKFVDAQFAKDRLGKINDMNFNHQVLSSAIETVCARSNGRFVDEVRQLQTNHREASLLLLRSLDAYTTHFAASGGAKPPTSAAATAAVPDTEPVQPPPPVQEQQNQQAEQRALHRRQVLVRLDLGLLFKLVVMVCLLGYDSGRQELTIMCLAAATVYLVSVGLLRLPQFAQAWLRQRGRIPHQNQVGFLIDLYSIALSLVLSIAPAWEVVGEDDEQPAQVVAAA